jgi:gliding motility-associated lipoprotein GldD
MKQQLALAKHNFVYCSLFIIYCSLSILFSVFLTGCRDYSPKPFGHFRIDIPEAEYHQESKFKNFEFQLSNQAVITDAPQKEEEFFNIVYPQFHAQIYCSYIPIKKKGDLAQFSEESRKFVYLHARKADAIRERIFEHAEQSVYGLVYDVKGNVASPTQFVLTDSVRAFFRGALYFENTPNQDSIAPVLDYINKDIQVIIESFLWKK